MRRNRNAAEELSRIHTMIKLDKSLMSDACKALVLQDFAEKCNEYFDLTGLPRMEIACKNGTYQITLSFEAERIKKFNVLK